MHSEEGGSQKAEKIFCFNFSHLAIKIELLCHTSNRTLTLSFNQPRLSKLMHMEIYKGVKNCAACNKGNYKQGEKTALRLGENNSKRSNRQRINLKNIQATPPAQLQKNK